MREYIIKLNDEQMDIVLSWFELLDEHVHNFDIEVYDLIKEQLAEQMFNRLFGSEGKRK